MRSGSGRFDQKVDAVFVVIEQVAGDEILLIEDHAESSKDRESGKRRASERGIHKAVPG